MDHIGIDVHKRDSQIYILAEGGEIIEQRIRTEGERFAAVLGARPRARILIEASTDSEWVARCLEALGHEVIVANPNFAPMYATRSRKVKTDQRDARALAEACLLGAYRPAHRLSDPQRMETRRRNLTGHGVADPVPPCDGREQPLAELVRDRDRPSRAAGGGHRDDHPRGDPRPHGIHDDDIPRGGSHGDEGDRPGRPNPVHARDRGQDLRVMLLRKLPPP
jgi:transposase